MNNFGILYRYELKKLSQKKILWISLGICLLVIAFSLLFPLAGNYYIDGTLIDSNYNIYLTDQAYRKDLSGRAIGQALLEETIEAYSHVPLDVTPYSLTEEYQTYARPYSEIFNLIRTWTGKDAISAAQWVPDEANFYSAMQTKMETLWNANYLTDSELHLMPTGRSFKQDDDTYDIYVKLKNSHNLTKKQFSRLLDGAIEERKGLDEV